MRFDTTIDFGRDEAGQFGERLRARIEEKVGVEDEESPERVTISLGVASGAPPDFDEISLIRNADAALYQGQGFGPKPSDHRRDDGGRAPGLTPVDEPVFLSPSTSS